MKRIAILSVLLILTVLCACADANDASVSSEKENDALTSSDSASSQPTFFAQSINENTSDFIEESSRYISESDISSSKASPAVREVLNIYTDSDNKKLAEEFKKDGIDDINYRFVFRDSVLLDVSVTVNYETEQQAVTGLMVYRAEGLRVTQNSRCVRVLLKTESYAGKTAASLKKEYEAQGYVCTLQNNSTESRAGRP